MSNKNRLSDGWHRIAGHLLYIDDGHAIRPAAGGSLYMWSDKYNCYINILPCKPSRIRYYASIENLRLKV